MSPGEIQQEFGALFENAKKLVENPPSWVPPQYQQMAREALEQAWSLINSPSIGMGGLVNENTGVVRPVNPPDYKGATECVFNAISYVAYATSEEHARAQKLLKAIQAYAEEASR